MWWVCRRAVLLLFIWVLVAQLVMGGSGSGRDNNRFIVSRQSNKKINMGLLDPTLTNKRKVEKGSNPIHNRSATRGVPASVPRQHR